MSDQIREAWTAGDAYEVYVGRWSRLVAREFVDWLGIPPGLRWLDIGCGTGALGRAVLDRCAPAMLTGIDPSEGFIGHARRHLAGPYAEFHIGDARTLPVEDAAFDVAVSGLVLNFVPDPAKAVAEMCRAVRPVSGVVAVYVWDYAEGMRMMRLFWDAAAALDPAVRDEDEGNRFPLCRPGPLRDLLAGAGLVDVDVRAIEVPTVFKDFDDCWSPFLGGQGPAPGYCMSLPEEGRRALRDRFRSMLPSEPDGGIRLTARAWAARARTAHGGRRG